MIQDIEPHKYNSTYGKLPTTTRANGSMSDLNVGTNKVTGVNAAIKYKFLGWYTAASGGTKITSSSKVSITDTQTLYAHWGASSPSGNIWFGTKDAGGGTNSSTVTINCYGYTKITLTVDSSTDTVTPYINGTQVSFKKAITISGNKVKLQAKSNGTNTKTVKWTLSN